MRIVALIFCLFLTAISSAQQNDYLDSFLRVNLGLHGAELTYELPINKSNLVLESGLGLGLGYQTTGTNDVNYTFALETPAVFFKSELKYLYNREKRSSKGKSIVNNSGGYLALQTKYSLGNNTVFKLSNALLTEIHWGFQTPLGERFLFNLHLGLGYMNDFTFNRNAVSPTLGIRFGYRLNK